MKGPEEGICWGSSSIWAWHQGTPHRRDDGLWDPAGTRPVHRWGCRNSLLKQGPHSQGFLKKQNRWVFPHCPALARLGRVPRAGAGGCEQHHPSCLSHQLPSCLCSAMCLFSVQFVLKCGSLGFGGFPVHWGKPQRRNQPALILCSGFCQLRGLWGFLFPGLLFFFFLIFLQRNLSF